MPGYDYSPSACPIGKKLQVPAFSSFKQGRLSRLLTEQKEFLFPGELECCFPGYECYNSFTSDKQAATICWRMAAGWWSLGENLLADQD